MSEKFNGPTAQALIEQMDKIKYEYETALPDFINLVEKMGRLKAKIRDMQIAYDGIAEILGPMGTDRVLTSYDVET